LIARHRGRHTATVVNDVARLQGAPTSAAEAAARASRLVVFAPSLLLTVTIERRGEDDAELHLHAGAQGLWVARMAAELGASVTLCTALGGETGTVLQALVGEERVELAASPCGEANGAYVHDRRSGDRLPIVEVPGHPLSRHEIDDLYGLTFARALDSEVLVLTGPQHPNVIGGEIYARLASDARANGVSVVADLTGDPLEGALRGGVSLLKISDYELTSGGLAADQSADALLEAAEALTARGAANVVVSRAAEPSIALVDGLAMQVTGPHVTAADAHGTGDSMTAAAAVGIARGLALVDALRLAAAAGGVNAMRHGLGTGTAAEVERLQAHVRIVPLTPSGQRARTEAAAPDPNWSR
jgi:1-phosphofructokinase